MISEKLFHGMRFLGGTTSSGESAFVLHGRMNSDVVLFKALLIPGSKVSLRGRAHTHKGSNGPALVVYLVPMSKSIF